MWCDIFQFEDVHFTCCMSVQLSLPNTFLSCTVTHFLWCPLPTTILAAAHREPLALQTGGPYAVMAAIFDAIRWPPAPLKFNLGGSQPQTWRGTLEMEMILHLVCILCIGEVTQFSKLAYDSANYGIYVGYQQQPTAPGPPWEESQPDPRDPPAINPRSWPSDRCRRLWNGPRFFRSLAQKQIEKKKQHPTCNGEKLLLFYFSSGLLVMGLPKRDLCLWCLYISKCCSAWSTFCCI